MRQAYQNKRARGRSRKGPNPLTKTYESNGPDVKIRGTASHIADKYLSLARDAQSSGDPVQTENYMQHAEHYLRIIAAAQPQHPQANFDQHADNDDDSETSEDIAAAEGGDQGERRRNNGHGRNGHHRRSPYRNNSSESESEEGIVTSDTPQPFVNAMLPKPANSAVNSAANGHDEQADTVKANGAAPIEEPDGADAKPAPRRRGRPSKAKPATKFDAGSAEV